ncbi:hypothetical protein KUTeg_003055 [Tegillarca granosa]|uniref:Anti-proliferative protein domain-containing protein n=1 Tax=Tegillarca granosa TaxID=220873 RepID=A0ABQ9FL11_TEGGR|nr:hypothetical protein KUTeg_003055 [Tegillarca granosa]
MSPSSRKDVFDFCIVYLLCVTTVITAEVRVCQKTKNHVSVKQTWSQNKKSPKLGQITDIKMHVEVSVALNFVISYLYNKLPRRRVDMFAAELENGLKKKFEGHWYPDKPYKGSGFRCVRMNGEKVDPVIINAAFNLGLDLDEVKSYLPEELTLWIDPAENRRKRAMKGKTKTAALDTADREVQAAGKGFNPDAQCFKPIDTLSSSLNNLCLSSGGLSPSSPTSSNGWPGSASTSPSTALFNSAISAPAPPPFRHHKDNSQTQFTAAMFAQTKFGSTKLKTQAKRPTRLSPTEFGNFLRQRRNSFGNFADFLPSPSSSIHSPMSSAATSPDSHKTFIDGINVNNVSYPNQFSHLLLAN